MLELTTPKLDAEGEDTATIDVFSIDGKVYTIPDKVRPSLTLRYLYVARTQGVGIAENWLAETMLGTDAFLALINLDNLDSEDYNKVIAVAKSVAFGEVRPKGQESNGSGSHTKTAAAQKRSPSAKRATGS